MNPDNAPGVRRPLGREAPIPSRLSDNDALMNLQLLELRRSPSMYARVSHLFGHAVDDVTRPARSIDRLNRDDPVSFHRPTVSGHYGAARSVASETCSPYMPQLASGTSLIAM